MHMGQYLDMMNLQQEMGEVLKFGVKTRRSKMKKKTSKYASTCVPHSNTPLPLTARPTVINLSEFESFDGVFFNVGFSASNAVYFAALTSTCHSDVHSSPLFRLSVKKSLFCHLKSCLTECFFQFFSTVDIITWS